MLGTFVPFRAVFRQPITLTISLLGSGLSFAMTLRFCQRHWPADGGMMLITLGLLWELAKLHLAARGLAATLHGRGFSERLGGAGLVLLALTLAAGSVGASLGCLVQTEVQDEERTLASSQAYARAVRDLEILDGQLAFLTQAAARDLAHGYRKRALETSQRVEELRPRRDIAVREMRGLEHKGATGELSRDDDPGDLLRASGDLTPRSLRFAVHLAVAVLLEIISMVGMFLLERGLVQGAGAPTGRSPRPRGRSLPPRSPAPSPRQAVEARPYTHRLTYRFGRAEGLLNQLGDSRRYQACRELMRRIGDYCLKTGWTNGVITEGQVRTLNTGASWRATQGHLCLLLDVNALTRRGDGCYEVAYFLDENPSVETREVYAREQRNQARSRKRRERSRWHANSASNRHADADESLGISRGCIPCHAEPTTTHVNDANAATHDSAAMASETRATLSDLPSSRQATATAGPPCRSVSRAAALTACNEFEDSLPWSKYLAPPRQGDDRAVGFRGEADKPKPAETTVSAVPGPRTNRARGGIPARLKDSGEPINLGSVVAALRQQNQEDRPEAAEAVFRQLTRAGVTQTQLRYTSYCLQVRRQKVAVENPLGYWLSIAKRQCALAQRAAPEAYRTAA